MGKWGLGEGCRVKEGFRGPFLKAVWVLAEEAVGSLALVPGSL